MLTRCTPAWLSFALALFAAGCGDPCTDLAKEICKCEASESFQRACTQRVDSESSGQSPTQAEQNRCSALLDTCNCKQLACGNLAACGLANDSGQAASATATCE